MNKDNIIALPCLIIFGLSLASLATSNNFHLLNSQIPSTASLDLQYFFENIDPVTRNKCLIITLVVAFLLVSSAIITNLLFNFTKNEASDIKKASTLGIFCFLAFSFLSSDLPLHWIVSESYQSDTHLVLITIFTSILTMLLTFYLIFNLGLISSMLISSSNSLINYLHFLGLLLVTTLTLALIFNFATKKTLELIF